MQGWVGTLGADALLATAAASQLGPARIADGLKVSLEPSWHPVLAA